VRNRPRSASGQRRRKTRSTRDLLSKEQFPIELTELAGHTHDYYGRSKQINEAVWAFLRRHQLASEPKYQEYEIAK